MFRKIQLRLHMYIPWKKFHKTLHWLHRQQYIVAYYNMNILQILLHLFYHLDNPYMRNSHFQDCRCLPNIANTMKHQKLNTVQRGKEYMPCGRDRGRMFLPHSSYMFQFQSQSIFQPHISQEAYLMDLAFLCV